jgi:Kef-type K+ transport system membrane component KefB
LELQQDLRLISDLVIVMCSAALGGMLFAILNQPLITGYLLAGSLIGPGGFGMVVELVQVETLAQLGVVFLLFALGIEFSPSKLHHIQGVAVLGGCTEILLAMLFCGVISDFSGAPCKEGLFIGAFLSMSSTTVVIKCLMERNEMTSLPGQIAVGTLILQDCTIGLLFALLPILGGNNSVSEGAISLIKTGIVMVVYLCICFSLSRSLIPHILGIVSSHGGELFQSTSIAFCLAISWFSDHLGLSLELGAFIAGLLVSSTPFADKMLQNIEPIRNFFAALFLTSIGMIMNPFFLWVHLDVLFATLLIVIFFKCTLITLVVRAFGFSFRTSLTVGISLAQVGEFSFVLLSRASAVGLVHQKLYLLLLGTTALSLVVAPILFKVKHHIINIAALLRWIKSVENS